MADYQLTTTERIVVRKTDNAWISDDPDSRDWVEYQNWLAEGGIPDPYVEPPTVPPTPTQEQEILFDHENRIRAQEGVPPLTLADFVQKMNKP